MNAKEWTGEWEGTWEGAWGDCKGHGTPNLTERAGEWKEVTWVGHL
jgi:hypothetical protein